ncbi:MAG TPA: methylated-DNA--[protein]-cysteine S-methyltransferase [Gaiellaceae bacterium]|nr:methylated-DNA--[protein]-cysteine S-methyltransferase [Gaiellaceae bacterium]
MIHAILDTPLGDLLLCGADGVVHEIRFAGTTAPPGERDDGAFPAACVQLAAYFAGERVAFDFPAAAAGTPFQRAVWDEVRRIPYGETATYAELARRIGRPRAVRAVGHANGRNPLPVAVPCHRVLGSDGSLTGYGGGLGRKRLLLELEARGCDREPRRDLEPRAYASSSSSAAELMQ